MNITLIVFLAILFASVGLAIVSRRGLVRSNLQDVMVANRTMGGFLVFFITAGEVYGIGTMIGLPGAIYSKGASEALWFLGYILLGYPVGYFITPLIWRIGKIASASTLSDLVTWRFNSATLGLILSILSVLLMLPFTMMQFAGMGIIVQYLGINLDKTTAVILAAAIGFIYLVVAGIRAPAWVSILKDTLMLAAIVIGGVIAVKMYRAGCRNCLRLPHGNSQVT
jgi:SSS family solute:Na+ symporter